MTKLDNGKRPEITSFVLHLAAMGCMLLDHCGGTVSNQMWMGFVGRIAFPIFAFLLAEGFFHTRDRKKYARRIFVFALISEIPFNLMMARQMVNPFQQNVLWTFLLGLGVMSLYEKIRCRKNLLLRLVLYVLATLGGYVLGFLAAVDYYGYGILVISLFYFTRPRPGMKPWHRVLLGLIQLGGMYWIAAEMIKGMMVPVSFFGLEFEVYKQSFWLLALPLIWLYNGKQGYYSKTVKYVYYWFYPVHMLILGLLLKLL